MVENVQPLTYKQDDCDEISARVSVIELQNHDPFEVLHSSDEHQMNIALVSTKPRAITHHSQEDWQVLVSFPNEFEEQQSKHQLDKTATHGYWGFEILIIPY